MRPVYFSIIVLFCFFIVSLIVGCNETPKSKIDTAKKEIANAQNMQADKYAAAEFSNAQRSFNLAMEIIRLEDKKLIFLRNYNLAAATLDKSIAFARVAVQMSGKEQEKERNEQEKKLQEELNRKATLKRAPAKKK